MKQILAIIAALIVFFVVVCPITPTPIAVLGGKAQVQTPAVAAISIVFTSSPRLERLLVPVSSGPAPLLPTTDLLDLTCVRLC